MIISNNANFFDALFRITVKDIILQKIRTPVDDKLREEQAGFCSERFCVDQIATLRIMVEQSRGWKSRLYINLIDFKKDFDVVDMEVSWKIPRHYGIPLKIVKVIKRLYEDTVCYVIRNTRISELDKDACCHQMSSPL